jgi:hypothetical protein
MEPVYTTKQEIGNKVEGAWFCFYHSRGTNKVPVINISYNILNLILSLLFILSIVGLVLLRNKKSKEKDDSKLKSYDGMINTLYGVMAFTFIVVFGQYLSCYF